MTEFADVRGTSAQVPSPRANPLLTSLDERFGDLEGRMDWCMAFYKSDTSELSELMLDQNDMIAVRAAWERQVRQFPAITVGSTIKTDPRQIERFVGFVEGRLHVHPPRAWIQGMFSVSVAPRRATTFHLPKVAHHRTNSIFVVPDAVSLVRDRGAATIAMADRRSTFSLEEFAEFSEREEPRIAVAFHDSVCVIAGYSSDRNIVLCLDAGTGAVRWRAYGWGSGMVSSSGRGHADVVELMITDDNVFAFATTAFAASIDRFDIKSGNATLRFGTADWLDRNIYLRTWEIGHF